MPREDKNNLPLHQALSMAIDRAIMPIYQYSDSLLIKPYVKGYNPQAGQDDKGSYIRWLYY